MLGARSTIYHGTQAGGSVTWRKSWLCEGRNVTNHNDPTFLYDYALHHGDMNRFKTTGSQDCGFVGIRDSFGGQSVDFTYSGTNAPYSNVRSYCEDGIFRRCFEGLTSHPGCYKEEWIDNTISDCYDDGLVIRGYMATVQGNVITSTYNETGYTLTITAPNLIASRQYDILTVGTTDFTLVGAPSNTVGTRFSATGPGIGTGTVTAASTTGVVLDYVGARRADVGNNRIEWLLQCLSHARQRIARLLQQHLLQLPRQRDLEVRVRHRHDDHRQHRREPLHHLPEQQAVLDGAVRRLLRAVHGRRDHQGQRARR